VSKVQQMGDMLNCSLQAAKRAYLQHKVHAGESGLSDRQWHAAGECSQGYCLSSSGQHLPHPAVITHDPTGLPAQHAHVSHMSLSSFIHYTRHFQILAASAAAQHSQRSGIFQPSSQLLCTCRLVTLRSLHFMFAFCVALRSPSVFGLRLSVTSVSSIHHSLHYWGPVCTQGSVVATASCAHRHMCCCQPVHFSKVAIAMMYGQRFPRCAQVLHYNVDSMQEKLQYLKEIGMGKQQVAQYHALL